MISSTLQPNFEKGNGLLPAIIQHVHTRKVLMLGYMSPESLEKTLATKKVTFWSRSRQELWTKGETSGNYLHYRSHLVDCDKDTILVQALPDGPTCHTGQDTCFEPEDSKGFVYQLTEVIADAKTNPREGSYTASLFAKGTPRIAKKVGEEATELVIEAMRGEDNLFLEEAADLLYHYLVLLENRGKKLEDVEAVLKARHTRRD